MSDNCYTKDYALIVTGIVYAISKTSCREMETYFESFREKNVTCNAIFSNYCIISKTNLFADAILTMDNKVDIYDELKKLSFTELQEFLHIFLPMFGYELQQIITETIKIIGKDVMNNLSSCNLTKVKDYALIVEGIVNLVVTYNLRNSEKYAQKFIEKNVTCNRIFSEYSINEKSQLAKLVVNKELNVYEELSKLSLPQLQEFLHILLPLFNYKVPNIIIETINIIGEDIKNASLPHYNLVIVNDKLKRDNAQLLDSIDHLKKGKEDSDQITDELTRKNSNLLIDLKRLSCSVRGLKEESKVVQEQLFGRIEQLKQENEQLKDHLCVLNVKYQRTLDILDPREYELMKEKIEKLQDQLTLALSNDTELQNLKKQNEELQKQLNNIRNICGR
jgi:hypothetical protein